MRDAQIGVVAALAAAISLLEAGGKAAKKGAASDKMFDQMIRDYKRALEVGRKAILADEPPKLVDISDDERAVLAPRFILIRYVTSCEQFVKAIHEDADNKTIEYWRQCRDKNHSAIHATLKRVCGDAYD